MYYCNKCGVVVYVNRPENPKKVDSPRLNVVCLVCKQEATYRKLLPEDIHAANVVESDKKFNTLFKKVAALEEKLNIEDEMKDMEVVEE